MSTENLKNENQAESPGRVSMPLEHIDHVSSTSQSGVDQEFSLDFQGFMPPQSKEVKAGLTANIIRDGRCRDKICVWRDREQNRIVVLDGIARLNICREKSPPLPEMDFIDLPDRDACREWIIDAQLNRRNLRGWWVAYFRGLKYNSQKKEAHRPNAQEPHQNDGVTVGETAKRIAREAGVSEATIERNAKFAKSIDQLKSDLGVDFGKKILNREFKNLTLIDINNLAEKSIDYKKAIAEILTANPEISLGEAETLITPPESGSTDTASGDNTTEPGNESADSAENAKNRRVTLSQFKKRQEDSREMLYGTVEVDDTSIIPNMIKTEEAIIEKLKELAGSSS